MSEAPGERFVMLVGACVCCALFQNFFVSKAVCAVRKVNDAAANVTVLFERVLHDGVAGMRIASHGATPASSESFAQ